MRIFTADIGGTTSRFALFEAEDTPDSLRCLANARMPSAAKDFTSLLARLAEEFPELVPERADRVVLAAAGPAHSGESITLTSLPFAVDRAAVIQRAPGIQTLLLNDFSAQALACLTPVMAGASFLHGRAGLLQPARECFRFPRAGFCAPCVLLGAGTGLGVALLVPDGEGQGTARVLPSEGGHTAFAFVSEQEQAFGRFVAARKRLAYTRGEDVLSGSGLALLHEFLTGTVLEPAAITAQPGFAGSAVCRQFARFYGRACRQLALTCLPSDMVISGGLAARCPELVRHPDFFEEWTSAPGQHRMLLENIRLWLNEDQDSALWGAAWAGVTGF